MQQKVTSSHRYQQVKQFVLDGIRDQRWLSSDKIPSENELVKLCDVSRMTARKAVEELANEGVLERIHGLGTFVKPQKTSSSFLEIKDITEEITARGKQHSSHLLTLKLSEKKPLSFVSELVLKNITTCFYSEILHFEDNKPIQFEIRYVNPKIVPDYLEQNFNKSTPARYLLKIAAVTKAHQIVEAIIVNARISELLQMKPYEPCLLINRVTWSGEHWATCSRFYHPGNRYQIIAED